MTFQKCNQCGKQAVIKYSDDAAEFCSYKCKMKYLDSGKVE